MAEQIQTLLRRLPSVDTVTQQVRQGLTAPRPVYLPQGL